MDAVVIIFILIFALLIAIWASSWGRNGFIWFLIAAFVSPLIAAIALLVVGKTIEKKASEQRMIHVLTRDQESSE